MMEETEPYREPKLTGIKHRIRSNTLLGEIRLKYLKVIEVLMLIPVMLVIVGLCSIPTITYLLLLQSEVNFCTYLK
jgi:hypothetical protein